MAAKGTGKGTSIRMIRPFLGTPASPTNLEHYAKN